MHKVKSSEKSLLIRSLTKENGNFPEEKFQSKKPLSPEFFQKIAYLDSKFQSVSLDSAEVAYTIAWYAAKKLIKRLKRRDCQSSLVGVDTDISYFHLNCRVEDLQCHLGARLISFAPTLQFWMQQIM